MIREVRDILKVRLPEVVMLTGLYAGGAVLYQHLLTQFGGMDAGGPQLPAETAFVLGLGTMSLLIVVQMQGWGFLRTVAVEPTRPQSPMELLKIGSLFFWRLMGFQFLYLLALNAVAVVAAMVLTAVLPQVRGSEAMTRWLEMAAFLVSYLVLLKPLMVIPALVLAHGATLTEAFWGMRRVDFWLPRAPAVLGVVLGLFMAAGMAAQIGADEGPRLWVICGVHGAIASLLFFGMYAATIRYVMEGQEDAQGEPAEAEEENEERSGDESF